MCGLCIAATSFKKPVMKHVAESIGFDDGRVTWGKPLANLSKHEIEFALKVDEVDVTLSVDASLRLTIYINAYIINTKLNCINTHIYIFIKHI